MRFEFGAVVGESWTPDGGIPQECSDDDCSLVLALVQVSCGSGSGNINFKCVSSDPDVLQHAARFITLYVRLVAHEPAPSKCALMSTSEVVRKDWRN